VHREEPYIGHDYLAENQTYLGSTWIPDEWEG